MNRSVIVPSRPLKVNRARSPERVLTPLSGILGTRSVGKPAMKCAPCRCKYPRGRRGSGSAPRLPSWGCVGTAGCPAASAIPGGCPPASPRRRGPRPARVGQQVDLGARVVLPKGHKRAHEFREGARHGDVVLRHAVRDAGLLRVHRGVAEHQGPS